MKLHARKFAIAGGITAGVVNIIYSLFLWRILSGMMPMTYMQMGFGTMLFGLMIWIFIGAIICWLFATIYNKLVEKEGYVK